MIRETTIIETPVSKHKVVLKAWITGREYESLNEPILKSYKVNSSKNNLDDSAEINGSVITEMTHKALEVWVESINDKTDNILETLLDMHKDDYQFVVEEINTISKKK